MLCDFCGYKNNKTDSECPNCGREVVYRELSDEEISENISRLADKTDYLIPTRFDIVMKWGFFALALTSFVVNLVLGKHIFFALIISVCFVLSALTYGYPKLCWEMEKYKLKIRANYVDDLTPNSIWSIQRKMSCLPFIVLAVILTLLFYRLV